MPEVQVRIRAEARKADGLQEWIHHARAGVAGSGGSEAVKTMSEDVKPQMDADGLMHPPNAAAVGTERSDVPTSGLLADESKGAT